MGGKRIAAGWSYGNPVAKRQRLEPEGVHARLVARRVYREHVTAPRPDAPRPTRVSGLVDGSAREVPAALAARTLLGGLAAVDVWYPYAQRQPAGGIDDVSELPTVISDLLIRGFRQL